LRITKVVAGDGAALVPPETVYTAHVFCTFEGVTEFDDDVEFGVNDPGIVSGLPVAFPVGTQCTITEVDSQGATWDPPTQTVTLEGEGETVLVDVTVTNTFDAGELTVTKVVDDGSGLVPDGTFFTINVACTFDGLPLTGYPLDVVLTTPDGLSETFTGLPFGTQCTVSEPNPNGAASVDIEPPQPVTIDEDTSDVTVTVTNTYPTGVMTVTKVVDGTGADFVPDDATFTVEVTCTYPAGFPAGPGEIPGFDPLVIQLTPGEDAEVGPLPLGSECTTTETGTGGAQNVVITPEQPVTIVLGPTSAAVTVTNTFEAGSFTVAKRVPGLPIVLWVPPGTEFSVEVTCTYPQGHPAGPGEIAGFDPLTVELESGFLGFPGEAQSVGPLPVGSVCTLAELDSMGAGVEIIPNPVTVPGPPPEPAVDVIVDNVFPVGSADLVKVIGGELAEELAPAGTSFTVEATCSFPLEFPAHRSSWRAGSADRARPVAGGVGMRPGGVRHQRGGPGGDQPDDGDDRSGAGRGAGDGVEHVQPGGVADQKGRRRRRSCTLAAGDGVHRERRVHLRRFHGVHRRRRFLGRQSG
jgi:hypothetical protein